MVVITGFEYPSFMEKNIHILLFECENIFIHCIHSFSLLGCEYGRPGFFFLCVLWERLQPFSFCLFAHFLYTSANTLDNIITHSLQTPPLSSPSFDPVKHPIISLIIGMPVVSSLSKALPHLPALLGNPEGDLELNRQPFSPFGSILRSKRPRQCA